MPEFMRESCEKLSVDLLCSVSISQCFHVNRLAWHSLYGVFGVWPLFKHVFLFFHLFDKTHTSSHVQLVEKRHRYSARRLTLSTQF